MNRPSTCLPLPEIYYDANTKEYWRENDRGGWQRINESTTEDELISVGYDCTKPKSVTALSETRSTRLRIQKAQDVTYAGPLAGYPSGFRQMGERNILVTSSPKIIEPCPGEWLVLSRLLENMLVDGDNDQRPYFFGWLKQAYTGLRGAKSSPGQAFCIAGPSDCAKSFLQTVVITPILGGRIGKPYQMMTGGTGFNSDLFGSEHLMIEDESASTDIRSRRNLGAALKGLTVNTTQRCHGKNRDPVMLEPFWRLSLTTNDEPENLLILPPLDDSLRDKIILLRAKKAPMPMPASTDAEKQAFRKAVLGEIPAFLQFLDDYQIPEALKDERFGVKSYQHPDLLAALTAAQPEERLLEIIDHVIFLVNSDAGMPPIRQGAQWGRSEWEGSAAELQAHLTERDTAFAREAGGILSWSNACGTYMGRLRKSHPERVSERKVNGRTIWTILRPNRGCEQPGGEVGLSLSFNDEN